ncbi:hypothetical protein FHU38_003758 [Saccharomonospora amisosensis]|uniref:Uncharacterized protein n=1 Tax=Saccharomonospora amisosensis TaxID=1128677 RepID=A0A7X5USH2_9PSEU|nr:hypothetical protein [Saccharomonospora amisosensis]NIJ13414.1 hypothetical protein [Saccharomonospora amisosensis]
MTSHNRRWAGQLRRQACSVPDLSRVARDHLPGSRGAASFEFTFAGPLHLVLPVVGQLRVEADAIEVHYGPWWFRTPRSNLAAVRARPGQVSLTFRDPVHGHEPVGVRHHELALAVDDPDRVARSLLRAPNANGRPRTRGTCGRGEQRSKR